MDKVLICIPTYNEAENIVKILDALAKIIPEIKDYEVGVVVIDDNSPDGTGELVEKYINNNPSYEVSIIHNTQKAGLGRAYVTGFKFAINKGAAGVIEMDSDFSHNPKYLMEIISAMTDYDFVVGSRYVKGGNVVGWTLKRKFISRWGNRYAKFILGGNINDLTGGFNCYRTEIFKTVGLDSIKSTGFSFQIELKYKVMKAGFRGKEVPIVFKDRERGTSKFSGGIFKEALGVPWKLRLGRM